MKTHTVYLFPLLSGLLMAAAFQYAACFWLGWIALVPLFLCFCAEGGRRAVKTLALYAAAFYLPLLSFLFALHPLNYLGFSTLSGLALLSLGWILLAAWETGGFVLVGLVSRWLTAAPSGASRHLPPRGGCREATGGARETEKSSGANLALLCALWIILEWLQGISPLGFTWGRLAVAQVARPVLIQGAALGGSLLVSALVLAVNALLALSFYHRSRRFLLIALAVFVLNWGGGALRLALPPGETPAQIRVGVVQGTLPSQLKWQEDTEQQNLRQYYQQSLAASREGARLILWPETTLAETLVEGQVAADNFYQRAAAECGAAILAGAVWQEQRGNAYNALLYVSADELQPVYGKRHLVPFGEYLPLRGLIEPLLPGLSTYMTSGLTPDTGDGLIEAAGGRFGAMICFESIFAPLARSSVAAGAEALLVATNDSWFWGTEAMRQHYRQAQLRAVEQNRAVLRAANAGFSGVIDNYGRSLREIAPEQSGYLLADTPLISRRSPYFYLGEWVLYAALGIIARQTWRLLIRKVR